MHADMRTQPRSVPCTPVPTADSMLCACNSKDLQSRAARLGKGFSGQGLPTVQWSGQIMAQALGRLRPQPVVRCSPRAI